MSGEHKPGGAAGVDSISAAMDSPAEIPLPADDVLPQERYLARQFWSAIRRWFATSTFAPSWLPASWRHPLVGYALAVLLAAVADLVMLLLTHVFPSLAFPDALALLAVAFAALTWGLGASLIATLAGAALLNFLVLPPHFAWDLNDTSDAVEMVLFLAVGATISIIASQTQRALQRVGALAASLATERARLDAMIEAVPDIVSIHDAQGRIVRLNHAGQRNVETGHGVAALAHTQVYEPRTVAGDPIAPEDLATARALRGEPVTAMELRYRAADGHDRFISVSAAPLRGAQGDVEGIIAITRDVSALRRSEREAAARAGQLEATFDSMADGVIVFDSAGHLLEMNATARELFGLDARPDYSLRPLHTGESTYAVRDDQGRLLEPEQWPVLRVLRGETLKGADAMDIMIHSRDGREALLSVSGAPVRDQNGAIAGAIIVMRDVTERRQLERRTHDALNALLAMAEALVLAPAETPIVEAPERAPADTEESTSTTAGAVTRRLAELTQSVLGCRRVGIVIIEPETGFSRPIAVAGLSPEQERQWWAEQQAADATSNVGDPAILARLAAGETLILDMREPPLNAQPNPYGISTVLIAPMRVSERLIGILALDYGGAEHAYSPEEVALAGAVAKLAALVLERERLLGEREEARANELALRAANRRMDEFMSIASHELRTPLTSIKMNMQMMARQLQRLAPDDLPPDRLDAFQGMLARAGGQLERLHRLIEDLLDVSRIQTGHLELHLAPCDLAAIVCEVVEEHRQAWPTREIVLERGDRVPIPVMADSDRVGQVITNYLSNALKYSVADRPVRVALRLEGEEARVLVQDEGPGLTPEEQTHIWERFYRANGHEQKVSGLGLGLYISRTIIERHQGRVGVQSTPGAGSTFWFTLPLAGSDL
jgi:PAS domain S-box-containing protein